VRALERRGHKVLATTRRQNTLDGKRIFLDFEDADTFRVPDGVRYAFVIAAATNYERCEKDPLARAINVDLIPRLVANLLDQGVFVLFISTNSVFGGERPWPGENDPHAPGIAYARQKSQAEQAINAVAERLKASERMNVVRLTKILNPDVPPLPGWFAAWKEGKAVEPFSDLIMKFGRLCFINTELDHRDVCLGKNMHKHRPGAVIEAPPLIKADVDWRQQILNATCKLRIAGSGIDNFKKFSRKTAEVVNRPWSRHGRYEGSR